MVVVLGQGILQQWKAGIPVVRNTMEGSSGKEEEACVVHETLRIRIVWLQDQQGQTL